MEEPTTDNSGAFAVSICGLLRTRGVLANMRGPTCRAVIVWPCRVGLGKARLCGDLREDLDRLGRERLRLDDLEESDLRKQYGEASRSTLADGRASPAASSQ